MDYTSLSKSVSHALRHEPASYGLELDAEGWVSVHALLRALSRRSSEWANLTEEDLRAMIQCSAKQRHELAQGRIRALYGHSTPDRISRQPATPPELLYHGTDAEAAACILSEGLKSMGRQFAHLSKDQETAYQVGKRKAAQPVMLVVRAAEAFASGVLFYEGNDSVWLADFVPAAYLARL